MMKSKIEKLLINVLTNVIGDARAEGNIASVREQLVDAGIHRETLEKLNMGWAADDLFELTTDDLIPVKQVYIPETITMRYPYIVHDQVVAAKEWFGDLKDSEDFKQIPKIKSVFDYVPVKHGDCDGDPEEEPVFNDFSDYISFDVEGEE